MKDYIEGFSIVLAMYQCVGWVFGAIYFSDTKKLTIYDWIFFVPGASIGIMSFMILPIVTVLCIIPVFINPNTTSLTLLGFGCYMCFSMYMLFEKEL